MPNYKNFRFALFSIAFISYTLSTFAQVGIGTIDPEVLLHIKGEYVAPVTNENTLLYENFEGYDPGVFLTQENNNDETHGDWPCSQGWEIRSNPEYDCAACRNKMLYIKSTNQNCKPDDTAIVALASNPTAAAINIYFAYKFERYPGDLDYMKVYLYNNDTDEQEEIFLVTDQESDGTHSSSWAVVPGNSYSLHFRYVANWGKGATVDNIEVTEHAIGTPGKYAFKFEDGTQRYGYVLTSDADGNATWQSAPSPRPYGNDFSDTVSGASSSEDNPENQQVLNSLKNTIRERESSLETERKLMERLEARIRELE